MNRVKLSSRFGPRSDQSGSVLDDLDIHFQPIFDVSDISVIRGFEALGRKSGAGGYKSIAPYLREIYEGGLRPELEMVTLERARLFLEVCDEVLPSAVSKGVYVTVNLSPQTLAQKEFLDDVDGFVGIYSQARDRIRFEILEHSFPENNHAQIIANILGLSGEGYQLYLDDYGDHPGQDEERLGVLAGHVGGIKLSGSLWKRSEESRIALLRSLNSAGVLHKNIVVEGVETDEQLHVTRSLPEDFGFSHVLAQGWHPLLGASMTHEQALEALRYASSPAPSSCDHA